MSIEMLKKMWLIIVQISAMYWESGKLPPSQLEKAAKRSDVWTFRLYS